MPNAIGASGLTTQTYDELLAFYTAAFQACYGADVNLASDTPDGQLIGILIQANLDLLDWVSKVNANFDPDQALGVILDQRVALNAIQRQAGTYSVTPITVVTDRALPLTGLDALVIDPNAKVYTVQDEAGNQWQLQTTQSPAAAGSYVYNFQASVPGKVLTTLNTITSPVSIVLGVVSVNNPSAQTTMGQDEETDAELKIRRQKATAIAAQGVHDALVAMLENIPGVTFAKVWENDTGQTSDGTNPPGVPAGIPRNQIWTIVAGTGSAAAIANALYVKRNIGCGMKGAQSQTITQKDGTNFVVKWDNVVPQSLYIQFDASSKDGITPVDPTFIKNQLATLFKPGVYETVDVTSLGTIVQDIDPNCVVTGAGFAATGVGPFTPTLTPTAANYQFTVSAVNISIAVI